MCTWGTESFPLAVSKFTSPFNSNPLSWCSQQWQEIWYIIIFHTVSFLPIVYFYTWWENWQTCFCFFFPQYWRQVYLITVLAMILAVFFAQIHPSYLTQQWHRLRSIIFCSVSGYGIIPTIHWVWLNGGIGASIVQVKEKKKEIRFPFTFCFSFCPLTLWKMRGKQHRLLSDHPI